MKTSLKLSVSMILSAGFCVGSMSAAEAAATTMYNRSTGFQSLYTGGPCAPCTAGETDGWVWGPLEAANGTDTSPTSWFGTEGEHKTPFGYKGGTTVHWAVYMDSAGSAEISSQDAYDRYGAGADIDVARGGWSDASLFGQSGWRHDIDYGLFKSAFDGRVTLNVAPVNTSGPTSTPNFGFTIFRGMDTRSAYNHHGVWNRYTNTGGPTVNTLPGGGSSFTLADLVAYSVGGPSPQNINTISFDATAGQVYTVVLGGYRNGSWVDTTDGYKLTVSAVPVPAAVWLFGSALAGLGAFGRCRDRRNPRRLPVAGDSIDDFHASSYPGRTLFGRTSLWVGLAAIGTVTSVLPRSAQALDCPPAIASAVSNAGDLTIAAGTTCTVTASGSLTFSQNTFTINGTLHNAGSVSTTLAQIDNYGTIENPGTFANGFIGTFSNFGSIANTGLFDNSGYISNEGQTDNQVDGVFNNSRSFGGAGSLSNAGSLTNTGTLTVGDYLTGGGSLINTGTLTNGKTLDVLASANVTNEGLLRNSGSLDIEGDFSNSGRIENSGTLSLGGGGSSPIQTNDGEIVSSAGYLFSGNLAGDGTLTQTAGTLEIGEISQSAITVQGGVVMGSDAIVHGDLTMTRGTLEPGLWDIGMNIPGGFTVNGALQLGDRLRVGLSGTEGSLFGYSRLDVSESATLGNGSTLEITLLPITPHSPTIFTPRPGDSFDLLIAATIVGQFGNVILPSINGVGFDLSYLTALGGGQMVRLTAVTAPVPVPAALWLFGSALAGLGGFHLRARNRNRIAD